MKQPAFSNASEQNKQIIQTCFWITVLIGFCVFLMWWNPWIGIPYSLIWARIIYDARHAETAPPHEIEPPQQG